MTPDDPNEYMILLIGNTSWVHVIPNVYATTIDAAAVRVSREYEHVLRDGADCVQYDRAIVVPHDTAVLPRAYTIVTKVVETVELERS